VFPVANDADPGHIKAFVDICYSPIITINIEVRE